MAYVVARPRGRFEIRESIHTTSGSRSRSLANFAVLTPEVLEVAAHRAVRPFDAEMVRKAARRAGVSLATEPAPPRSDYRRFVETSRAMGQAWDRVRAPDRGDPGQALLELLGFADQIARSQPPQTRPPLAFPVLARLAAHSQPGG